MVEEERAPSQMATVIQMKQVAIVSMALAARMIAAASVIPLDPSGCLRLGVNVDSGEDARYEYWSRAVRDHTKDRR